MMSEFVIEDSTGAAVILRTLSQVLPLQSLTKETLRPGLLLTEKVCSENRNDYGDWVHKISVLLVAVV